MRIVGGTLSGRRFRGPPGDATRPTSERVREAIASALEARGALEGAVVLDLFAGTGALAFEALSRGAARAVLVERDRRVAAAIARSAEELGLDARSEVVVADLETAPARWIPRLAGRFDLVFCDPPYARVDRALELLTALLDAGAMAADVTIVLEHGPRDAPVIPRGFEALRSYRYGDTAVLLLGAASKEPR